MNVLEARGLGKRYGRAWALRECTLEIPAGHVAALVGPNGAGKTTLLNLAVGLTAPTAGAVTVLGGRPAGAPAALAGIAFVAQDTPLYRNLSAADMMHVTRNLNRRFDQPYAEARLAELGIPLSRKAGKLSGGQQAQLAPTVFGLRGVAFAAWTLAAFALGALAGMLIRRVVAAIAATLAVYAGLALAVMNFLRQHYLTPLVSRNLISPPASAWIISQWWTKGSTFIFAPWPPDIVQRQDCPDSSFGPDGPSLAGLTQCFVRHGYTRWTSYQPASRFWPFQWIEGGWLLALSVLLIAATVWLVRRRAAG